MIHLKKLIRCVQPNAEENLIGYVVRLTEINDYDTPSWILQLSGIKNYLHSKCNFVCNSSIDLSYLAWLTGLSLDRLSLLQYMRVNIESFGEGYLMCGLPVPQYMIRINKPKVCPECLDALGYARRVWDFAPLTACPLHGRMLLADCPSCGKPVTWSRKRLSICQCGYDWRKTTAIRVQNYELNVSRYIYELCGLTDCGPAKEYATRDNPLLELDLCTFTSALFFVASQFNGIIDTRGKHLAPSKTNLEIHILLSRAFQVFEQWPKNFFGFLDWRRAHSHDENFVKGLRRDFGQYKSALYLQLSSVKLNFMRDAFEEYLATNWDGGNASVIVRVNRSSQHRRKYLSRREAKDALRIGVRRIDRLIEIKTLKAIVHQQGASKLILIEAASVVELKLRLEKALGIKQVEMLLGITSKRIKELVKTNLLHPFRGPSIDKNSDWKFDSSEVKALLHALKQKVSGDAPRDTNSMLNFLTAFRVLRQAKIETGQFVKAIAEGEISPCGNVRALVGLRGLLFRKSDLLSYAKRYYSQPVGYPH